MFLLVPAYPGCPGSKAVKRSLLYAGSENLLTIHLCHIIFRLYHVRRLWPIATDVAYSMVSVSAVGHINGPCENDVCGQCLPDS